jgi:hypothetical protein
MAYWQWGNLTVPMWFVTNTGCQDKGRDFDVLARELCAGESCQRIRVVCDVVGRGENGG